MLQFYYIRLACHCLAYLEDPAVCMSPGKHVNRLILHGEMVNINVRAKEEYSLMVGERHNGHKDFFEWALYECEEHCSQKNVKSCSVKYVVFPCRKEWTKLHSWYLSCSKMTSLAEFRKFCLTASHGHAEETMIVAVNETKGADEISAIEISCWPAEVTIIGAIDELAESKAVD
ncbi:hypothetical protein H5410_030450 [Solanum commersonii]|uniref:Uncharacterized protein n=1 Tax=Solanum commersonii TaxID=4109 RepID=A0A9J5YHF6_SOLCO|nr:hypothetical protein H5410_030450 [Solanum commersonii]